LTEGGRERGVWGACPQVYLELVVADPGIDGRGRERGLWGLARGCRGQSPH